MDQIMGWLSKVDLTTVVAAAVTFLIGLAVVKPKLSKAMSVIGDLADLLSVLKASLSDGKLTSDEVKAIITEGEELIAEFKK
jgi:hypothetical protein